MAAWIETAFFVKVSLPFSETSLPFWPTTSKRFVPGASPVVVMKMPVAPLGYSR